MFYSHDFIEPPQSQDIVNPKNSPEYLKVHRDYGPVSPANISEGLTNYIWETFWGNGYWHIFRVDDPEGTIQQVVFSGLAYEPEFYDLTFDTAGRPFICWENTEGIQIFWYDPTISDYTISNRAAGGRNPHCHLDYRVSQQQQGADIILCYERDNAVYYRITSNRYTVEYPTPITDLDNRRIHAAGVGRNLRYTIKVA